MNQKPEIPKDLIKISEFLASQKSELKTREGVLNGKRVVFFKGKHLSNAMLRESYHSKLPKISNREDSIEYAQKLLDFNLILNVNKQPEQKTLEQAQNTRFSLDNYYCWIFAPNQFYSYISGIAVLLVIFIGVMFPLWPPFMRQGVYYLSLVMMGLLGVLMGLGVIRAILWVILIIVIGRGILQSHLSLLHFPSCFHSLPKTRTNTFRWMVVPKSIRRCRCDRVFSTTLEVLFVNKVGIK